MKQTIKQQTKKNKYIYILKYNNAKMPNKAKNV